MWVDVFGGALLGVGRVDGGIWEGLSILGRCRGKPLY